MPAARLIAAVALLLLFAPSAAASAGRCLPGGPTCTFWTARVLSVADGDTIDVDLDGDGSRARRRVRLTGINAMELSRYSTVPRRRRGDCHAREATARLEQLVRRGRARVRLAAEDPASRSGPRLRRQVSVRLRGRWVDVGRALLAEGHALWLPNHVEWAWNRSYAALSERAAASGLRLWDPRGCGPGPAAAAPVSMRLNYDADGNDGENVAGEWAEIRNGSSAPLSLERWWFRDSGPDRYTFPAAAVVPAGGSLRLSMGAGADGAYTFHWGLTTPPLNNITRDVRALGDGGYLFDPRGNMRAWVIYHP